MEKTVIYWRDSGPLIAYGGGRILVTDQWNGGKEATWSVSRGEMFRMGWKFILASIR